MAGTEILRDAMGRKLGEIKDRGSRLEIYDAMGRKMGYYDGRYTYDAMGRKYGEGNLLARLI